MNLENHKILMEWIRRNRFIRRKLARVSHSMFFAIYFHRYMTKPTAPFQREIFAFTERKHAKLCVVSAFRGSGKSTICATSFPIWAMISGQAHFIVIAGQTRTQARQQLKNIRDEFESNALLRNDFGPFETESDEWGAFALNFKNYGTKLMAVSTEQAIRGIRHKQYRPDIVILDDIEDLNSTRTKESCDRIYSWFTSEIVPLGMQQTRIFVLGNFLHDYSLVGRLIAQITSGTRDGVFKRYPLIDDDGKPLWPGMFPTPKEIEDLRRTVGDEVTWKREYMLEIIPDDWQVIHQGWIKTYDELPKDQRPHTIKMGIDLAISEKESADYTAIVSAAFYGYGKDAKIYFLDYPVNRRMNFPDTLDRIEAVYRANLGLCGNVQILVEDVAYQKAAIDSLKDRGYFVYGIKVADDKRSRLMNVSNLIKNGQAMFPKKGTEAQLQQVVGFGKERFDDLVDATTMILLHFIKEPPTTMEVQCIAVGRPFGPRTFAPLIEESGWADDLSCRSFGPSGSGISSSSGGEFLKRFAGGDFLR
jgi:predicted phage terminase large subunit-like protein